MVNIFTRGSDLIICGLYVPPWNDNHGTEERPAVLTRVLTVIEKARLLLGADKNRWMR